MKHKQLKGLIKFQPYYNLNKAHNKNSNAFTNRLNIVLDASKVDFQSILLINCSRLRDFCK